MGYVMVANDPEIVLKVLVLPRVIGSPPNSKARAFYRMQNYGNSTLR